MKNKKIIIIAAVVLAVLAGTFFLLRGRGETKEKEEEITIPQPETIAPEELPYFTLYAKENNHKLVLSVLDDKNFNTLEYELVYELEDGLARGVMGEIDLTQNSEKEILLGTCSSGTCRYDEGVIGGQVIINLEKEGKVYSHEADFVLLEEGENFTNSDGEISLTAQQPLCLLTGAALPKSADQEEFSCSYTLTSISGNSQATVDTLEGKLLFWQENNWQELDAPETLSEGTYLLVD